MRTFVAPRNLFSPAAKAIRLARVQNAREIHVHERREEKSEEPRAEKSPRHADSRQDGRSCKNDGDNAINTVRD